MPGYLITDAATVNCAHQGDASPLLAVPRLSLGGDHAVLQAMPYQVSACTMPPPPGGNGPCVIGRWQSGAMRVSSFGLPLAIQESPGTCLPTATPMTAVATQTRVRAT